MPKEYILQTTPIEHATPYAGITLFDDLTPPLQWVAIGYPAGYLVQLDTQYAFKPPFSLHLRTNPTDPQAEHYAEARRYLPMFATGVITLNTLFFCTTSANVYFHIHYRDGTDFYDAIIKYLADPGKWAYHNSGGTYTDIPNSDHPITTGVWTAMGFGFDINTKKYTTLRAMNLNFDLSNLDVYKGAPIPGPLLDLRLRVENSTTTQSAGNFDMITVTHQP